MMDTTTFLRSQGAYAGDKRSPACKAFWSSMLDEGRTILLAAPTLAETLRDGSFSKLKIPLATQVVVVPFDRRCAEVLSDRAVSQPRELSHRRQRLPHLVAADR